MLHTVPLLLVAALAAPVPQAEAALERKEVVSHFNLDKQRLAIQGYDPVAYFPEGGNKASKGSKKFLADYRGVRYRFTNGENRATFLSNPERYEPAFGGWCAYAVANSSEKVEVDPESFLIEGERLFLFFDGVFADTRKRWLKDPKKFRKAAPGNWTSLTKLPVALGSAKLERKLSSWTLGKHGLAFAGWDPVSLADTEQKPLAGLAIYELRDRGVLYRFATPANRARFLADPARFEPAFGGWGAWSLQQRPRVAGVVSAKQTVASPNGILLFATPGNALAWSTATSEPGQAWADLQRAAKASADSVERSRR